MIFVITKKDASPSSRIFRSQRFFSLFGGCVNPIGLEMFDFRTSPRHPTFTGKHIANTDICSAFITCFDMFSLFYSFSASSIFDPNGSLNMVNQLFVIE